AAVERRLGAATGMAPEPASPHTHPAAITPEALSAALAQGQAPVLLDVRRRKAFDAGADMVQGATWRQPEIVADWADSMPRDREVVVYCVYGHNVSYDTVEALRAKGVKARPLTGGIAAWHAIGGPVIPKSG